MELPPPATLPNNSSGNYNKWLPPPGPEQQTTDNALTLAQTSFYRLTLESFASNGQPFWSRLAGRPGGSRANVH